MNRQDAKQAKIFTRRADPELLPESLVEHAESSDAAEFELETQNSKLKAFFTNPYFTLISRLVLGGIFLLAGLSKLGDAATLANNIGEYQMGIREPFRSIMANVLPPLEIGL